MSDKIDYRSVNVPADLPPEDYTYAQRRADLLREIERVGHPGLVNGAEMARRYGCSRQNIYNDLDVLADYVADRVGDRQELTTNAVFQRCLRGLLEEGEWRDAARTAKEWSEWVDGRELDELWDRLEDLERTLEADNL